VRNRTIHLVSLIGLPLLLCACQRPSVGVAPAPNPADVAPLELVVKQVKASLDEYQKSIGNGKDALPPISSAEFEFKVTTAKTAGGTVTILIFKLGASREKDIVNDVAFAYYPPTQAKAVGDERPVPLTEELASTIQSAAAAVKNAPTIGPLNFSKLTVVIQFAVKWDGTIGATVPISIVTAGLSGDMNQTSVQSVKLTFGK